MLKGKRRVLVEADSEGERLDEVLVRHPAAERVVDVVSPVEGGIVGAKRIEESVEVDRRLLLSELQPATVLRVTERTECSEKVAAAGGFDVGGHEVRLSRRVVPCGPPFDLAAKIPENELPREIKRALRDRHRSRGRVGRGH